MGVTSSVRRLGKGCRDVLYVGHGGFLVFIGKGYLEAWCRAYTKAQILLYRGENVGLRGCGF